eukprot:838608-Rhodomonas_salina.1
MIGGSGRDSQLSVSQKNLKREAVQGANRLTLQLESKGPGKYEETVVLRSRLDVRVYAIEMVVAPPEQRAALEFACALRQSIHQSIPVVNASNAAWNIQAKLSGDGFMGGTNLTVCPVTACFSDCDGSLLQVASQSCCWQTRTELGVGGVTAGPAWKDRAVPAELHADAIRRLGG